MVLNYFIILQLTCKSLNLQKDIVTTWFDEHNDYLFQFAHTKLLDRELAKDLVQDTFVAAFQAIDSFKGESSPRTWLASILKNKITDYWRKEKREQTKSESQFFKGDNEKGAGSWLSDKAPVQSIAAHDVYIEEQERQSDLEACLQGLPSQWNAIVVAKFLLEQKSDEICNEFEISSSNYWVIIHRAKLLLRDCLNNKWF